MVLAGLSKEQIIEKLKAAKAKKENPAAGAGRDLAFMMSKQADPATHRVPHSLSHVMFFVPSTDPANWGANSAESPVALLQQDSIADINTFMIPVGQLVGRNAGELGCSTDIRSQHESGHATRTSNRRGKYPERTG